MKLWFSPDKSFFFEWTIQVCTEHPDVLEQMRASDDPLDRVIAVRILTVAQQMKRGVANENLHRL